MSVWTLEVVEGLDRGRSVTLGDSTLELGRGEPDASTRGRFFVGDFTVSARQAVIFPVADGYMVENLSRTNPTHVNGQPVSRHRLSPGDRLEVGKLVIEVRVRAPEPSDEPAPEPVHTEAWQALPPPEEPAPGRPPLLPLAVAATLIGLVVLGGWAMAGRRRLQEAERAWHVRAGPWLVQLAERAGDDPRWRLPMARARYLEGELDACLALLAQLDSSEEGVEELRECAQQARAAQVGSGESIAYLQGLDLDGDGALERVRVVSNGTESRLEVLGSVEGGYGPGSLTLHGAEGTVSAMAVPLGKFQKARTQELTGAAPEEVLVFGAGALHVLVGAEVFLFKGQLRVTEDGRILTVGPKGQVLERQTWSDGTFAAAKP